VSPTFKYFLHATTTTPGLPDGLVSNKNIPICESTCWRALEWKMFLLFYDQLEYLWPLGIIYGSLWSFGACLDQEKSGIPGRHVARPDTAPLYYEQRD
jgi:hypothetical protein